ncbi:gas vesicle structural protein GvpA [Streptomyces rochei]|uniref:Gas vesicle protein A n=1 Tax=Streptomyces vinaceusdrappus TaxID=67376 RepID=A0ABY6C3C6_9ACTN|nr:MULTISPECIES: gas vesicle structural protein GvpA [Streptomyces]MBQ0912742.1 gas vesicle structural protein GvpA [Streptomyces sp. RM99]NUV97419.1 gas vesicle structural protein GvpA [Streptomyces sp. KAI 90]RSS19338.1 gas vesicle structural protein GvpA [Streptomyces sp. WAC08401]UXI82315.1 gas vesicle structural protein GvpA [Streptomyces vinaceusdrappus]
MITYDDEVVCAPRAGTLYDVLELILDRGMVIDVFVRVSLVGIEILKVDARIVVASVDTYLRFAEACNRLDLEHDVRSKTVPEMFGSPVAKTIGRAGAKHTARSLTDKVRDILSPEEEAEAAAEEETRPRSRAVERTARARAPERRRTRPAARSPEADDRPRSRPRRRPEPEDE